MSIDEQRFGRLPDGRDVVLYTMTSGAGVTIKVTNFGGILTSVRTPDARGDVGEITLGFDSINGYLAEHPFLGATVGRFANRIAGARFSLDGKDYELAANASPHHLHGGHVGFDKVLWQAEATRGNTSGDTGDELTLRYTSVDGEEGYPGELTVTVTYALSAAGDLSFSYHATTTQPTLVNLTNHTYWNLAGDVRESCLGHLLQLHCSRYLPGDASNMPTGEIANVADTPMAFDTPTSLGSRIADVAGGYDHCYLIDGADGQTLRPAATVVCESSGRVMDVSTTMPGVQLYTSNYLDGSLSSRGATFDRRIAFCLETQHLPNSPNEPAFPSPVLRRGQTYAHRTVHQFRCV